MDSWTVASETAFDAYVEALIGVIGHADRAEPLRYYCLGLMMPVERKSVGPLAAVAAPSRRPGTSRCCISWGRRRGRTRL
jgi:SRSO17 transposase